ncbi:MAG: PilZ domain-containing protein [bacterium]
MANRRGFLRYTIKAKVCFKYEGNISKTIEGQLVNISFSGLGVFFKESIDVNTIIQFDLTANFIAEHLIGKGKIIYAAQQKTYEGNGFKIGVEFIEVNNEIVLRFISENQRKVREEQKRIIEEEKRRRQLKSTDFGPF